jgi:uncharacterized membrane protein
MELVKKTFVGFLCGLFVYALMVELIGVFFSDDIISYSLGLLIGVVAAILLFTHMAWTLDKALDYPEAGATKYVRTQTFLRLLAMVIVMLPGLVIEKIQFISLVLGLLGLKIGALIAPFFLRRLYPDDFVTDEETLSRVLEDDEDKEDDDN